MGTTIELRGERGNYRLCERWWEGVGSAEYSTLAHISDGEADCLVQCRYFNKSDALGFQPSDIDPRTLLRVGPWEPHANLERLIITLPRDTTQGRDEPMEFVDPSLRPGYDRNWRDREHWYEWFRGTDETKTEWSDNALDTFGTK